MCPVMHYVDHTFNPVLCQVLILFYIVKCAENSHNKQLPQLD